jgi:predicted regulator of Ras-like GTPase activity (Roadblock/LC7/MglB family)
MLRPSALRKLLFQVIGANIQATLLLTRSGEYLDYAVKPDNAQFNPKSVGAIICSIYQSFQKFSAQFNDQLNYLIIDCDMYRLAIKLVGNHILCICADSNTGLGILKLKLMSLGDSLSTLLDNTYCS